MTSPPCEKDVEARDSHGNSYWTRCNKDSVAYLKGTWLCQEHWMRFLHNHGLAYERVITPA